MRRIIKSKQETLDESGMYLNDNMGVSEKNIMNKNKCNKNQKMKEKKDKNSK